jgi:X-X-X-Leu-X-X-Gly heptad repeat protein
MDVITPFDGTAEVADGTAELIDGTAVLSITGPVNTYVVDG